MDNANFGKLISILRKRKGITQQQLADELGVTTSAVSKWENGKNLPDTPVVTRICDFFDLTLDELFNPAETIERLQNETMEKKMEVIKKKWYQKKFLLPLLCVLLIVGVVITVIIVNKDSDAETQDCSLYSVRTCTDDVPNDTVYEMAYICPDMFDYVAKDPFIQAIFSGWLADPNVPQDINTLKISFFNDEASASEWLNPYCSIYLLRKE